MFSGDIELNLVLYFCNSVQNNSATIKLSSNSVLEQRFIDVYIYTNKKYLYILVLIHIRVYN